MTVADLIELLKTLDQERGIWIFYDYPCDAFAPDRFSEADKDEAEVFEDEGVKEGDYVFCAG